jgi:hypothetical protein
VRLVWPAAVMLKRRNFIEELLEQLSELKRWSHAAVAQNRRCFIGVAVEIPFDNRRRAHAWLALWSALALRAALARRAFFAAMPLRGNGLPTVSGARAGIVASCNECGTVARHDVQHFVGGLRIERSARTRRASCSGQADPVFGIARHRAGVAQRLPTRAGMGHDLRFIEDAIRLPGFCYRKLAGRPLLATLSGLSRRTGRSDKKLVPFQPNYEFEQEVVRALTFLMYPRPNPLVDVVDRDRVEIGA